MIDKSSQTWEEVITHGIFIASVKNYGLTNDPDNILGEKVLTILKGKGWQFVSVLNPMGLRFEYG